MFQEPNKIESLGMTGAPPVGDGNPGLAFILELSFENGPLDEFVQVNTGRTILMRLAERVAAQSTRSTNSLQEFTNGDGRTQKGARAKDLLVTEMAIVTHRICRGERNPDIVIPTQEFLFEAAIRVFEQETVFGLFISDVHPKTTAIQALKHSIDQGITPHVFVWNREAKDELTEDLDQSKGSGKAHIHLVEHPMVRMLLRKICQDRVRIPGDRQGFYFKPSGLGIPVEIIDPILESLGHQSGTVVLSRNMDSYKPSENGEHEIVRTETPQDVVEAHIENFLNREVIFAMPSEMIALYSSLIVAISEYNKDSLHNIRIPTFVCLPPKGEHEVENLKWAIKHRLISYIILPEDYVIEDREIQELIDSGKLQVVHPHKVGEKFQEFRGHITQPTGEINGDTDITAVVTDILSGKT